MTELTRTKAVSVPKDSERDCRLVHSSARRIVHDIITREDIILSLSSAAATVSSAVDMDSSNAVATSKAVVADMDSSSAVDMDSSAVATSKAVVVAMDSSAEDSVLTLQAMTQMPSTA